MATGGEIEDEANTLINMSEKCSIGTCKFKKEISAHLKGISFHLPSIISFSICQF